MFLSLLFFTSFFVPYTVGASFHYHGSVNESAPYSNSTLGTTSSITSTDSTKIHSTSSSSTLLSSVDGSDTEFSRGYGFVRPTNAVLSGSTALSVFSNATSALQATLNISSLVATLGISSLQVNGTATPTTRIFNATCTINIPNASIHYWHPATYSFAVGTMTTSALNFTNAGSYTLLPATTSFDAVSALASDWACTASTSYISEWDYTMTDCVEYTEKPNVAATSVAYRTAYAPFPSGGVISIWDAWMYDLYYVYTLPPATATVSLAPNITRTETYAIPFVYFTAYEIESSNKTETIQLPSAYAYPYWLNGVEREATATGSLPEGFLEKISQSTCDAGKLQATITVLIVVDLFYMNNPDSNLFLIHFESSVLGFEESPVLVHNTATSKGQPITVADWDLSATTTKPTSASEETNFGEIGPVSTTQVSNCDHNNNAEKPALHIPDPEPSNWVTVGTIGTSPVKIGPLSQVVVGAQTLQPGGPPITLGGRIPVSLAPSASAIVVGGTMLRLPQVFLPPIQPQPRPPPILTIGSSTLTPNAATQFFVDPGQTLTPGGVATVHGTVVSLAPSADFVVIGGLTQMLSFGPESIQATGRPPYIVVGNSIITAQPTEDTWNNPDNLNPGPRFVVAGQTLAPDGPAITVQGTTLSLAPSGLFVVVNGVPSAVVMPAAPINTQLILTVGNDIFSPLPGSGNTIVIAEQTLIPGGSVITVAGTTLPLAPSAAFVVINGATSSLARPVAPFNAQPTIVVGNEVFGPVSRFLESSFVVGDRILAPGGSAVTISGTTLSLAASASFIVINGITSTIENPAAPTITVGGNIMKLLPASPVASFILHDQTLIPGGSPIIFSGTTLSLASSASFVVVNGVTSTLASIATLFPATDTRVKGIMSTSDPRVGASGWPGATSSKEGSAAQCTCAVLSLFFVSITLGCFLGWV